MSAKAKAIAMYLGPAYNHADFQCKGCFFFGRDARSCELLDPPAVKPSDSCNLFLPGKPQATIHRRLIMAENAGLTHDGPFTCAKCEHFTKSAGPGSRGTCDKIIGHDTIGDVDARGCCNAWEPIA